MGFALGAIMLLIFIGECLSDLSEGDMVWIDFLTLWSSCFHMVVKTQWLAVGDSLTSSLPHFYMDLLCQGY